MLKRPLTLPLLLIFASLISCGETSDIKKAVSIHLKDPASAQFGNISVVKMQEKNFAGNNVEIACVSFNAKNSLGGYVGEHQALVVKMPNGWEMDGEAVQVSHEDCVKRLNQRSKLTKGEIEPFVVSLADKGTDRYLSLSIIVNLEDESDWPQFRKLEPRVRNKIVLLLMGKTSEELSTDANRQQLTKEITNEINSATKIDVREVTIKSIEII